MMKSSGRVVFALLAGLGAALAPPRAAAQVAPVSPVFQVSPPSADTNEAPAVATRDGGFLVAWMAVHAAEDGTEIRTLLARSFAESGAPEGDAVAINASEVSDESDGPALAQDPGGMALAVWQGAGEGEIESSARVVGRLLAPSGAPAGPEIEIDPAGEEPDVAALGGGRFVVVWRTAGELLHPRILARFYDDSGAPEGPAFPVSRHQGWIVQGEPKVDADARGRFVVVWERGNRLFNLDLAARLFGPDGTPLGDSFEITGARYAEQPAVAFAPDGGFTVAWVRLSNVWAARFDRSGRRQGGAFVIASVNPDSEDGQSGPAVAFDPSGRSVIAWSRSQTPQAVGQLFSPGGRPRGGHFPFDLWRANDLGDVAIDFLPDGKLVGVWQRPGRPAGTRLVGRIYQVEQ